MFAVVRTGGKQFKVEAGSIIDIEKVTGEAGDKLDLAEVLLVANGEEVKVGQPLVDGAKVNAEIVAQHRGDKKIIFKKKRRQGYSLKKGHRQSLTRVKVNSISS